ncbi:Phage capsid family protein [Mycobacterium marinum]|uniref:Phage capsid family protein n=1 Tax=Mycobacterium marinum TaxID=1781 RepID=A0A3E2N2D2_MYCMR|nr:phage major capsid protein [Mycobacterium marinum]RFZ47549.1 Phage capsid family protein [Mycobacterium marinum]
MTEIEVESMNSEQTYAAAQALLDSVDGELVGAAAERFEVLRRHSEALKQGQERRARAAGDMMARFRAGELGTEGGSVGQHRIGGERDADVDRTPVDRMRDAAMRTLDASVRDGTLHARGAETVEHLMSVGPPGERSWAARWAAAAGDQAYLRAFAKKVTNPENGADLWTPEESQAWRTAAQVQAERAMSTIDTAGGFLIPAQLDPAILLSSDGSTDPLREMARVTQTVGDVWHGVSSAGVVANWYNEAEEVSDDSPELAQPSVPNYRGSAWVPFSFEVGGDGAGFVDEIRVLLMDAVTQLNAAAYVNGSGTGQPTGFISALTGTAEVVVTGAGSEAVVAADPYKLQNALPPRFQMNSAFAGNLTTINVLRQEETSAGALKFPSLQDNPPMLCGKKMWEVSNMASVDAAVTATTYPLVLGDWSRFIITDRVGSTVELVPHVFGANRRPTGQRGFFAWFRTGSDVLTNEAFRVLSVATTA